MNQPNGSRQGIMMENSGLLLSIEITEFFETKNNFPTTFLIGTGEEQEKQNLSLDIA